MLRVGRQDASGHDRFFPRRFVIAGSVPGQISRDRLARASRDGRVPAAGDAQVEAVPFAGPDGIFLIMDIVDVGGEECVHVRRIVNPPGRRPTDPKLDAVL